MVTFMDLDRRKPLWPQIAEQIKNKIRSGELAKGDRIPGIHALMQEYSVTNSTAQKALKHLKETDWAESWSGSGTYVKGNPEEEE